MLLYINFQKNSFVTSVFIEKNVHFTEKYDNTAYHFTRLKKKKLLEICVLGSKYDVFNQVKRKKQDKNLICNVISYGVIGGRNFGVQGGNLATYISVTKRVSKVNIFLIGRALKTEQFKKKSKSIAFILFCKNAFQ